MKPIHILLIFAFLLPFIVRIAWWLISRWLRAEIDALFPPTPELQAKRNAEQIARQATKEFKRRQRLRGGWFRFF